MKKIKNETKMNSEEIESFRNELKECLKTTFQIIDKLDSENIEKMLIGEKGFTGILHGQSSMHQVTINSRRKEELLKDEKKEGEIPPNL